VTFSKQLPQSAADAINKAIKDATMSGELQKICSVYLN
jgi:ABC-type amino acid transport substrate-binding protein